MRREKKVLINNRHYWLIFGKIKMGGGEGWGGIPNNYDPSWGKIQLRKSCI